MENLKGARWWLLLALCTGGACDDDAKDSAALNGGECTSDFNACGGDLVGTWEFTGACLSELPDLPFEGEAKAFASCDDAPKIDVTLDLSGEAHFGDDGSFHTEMTSALSGGVRISDKCLAQAAESMGESALSCADIEASKVSGGCLLDAGGDEPSTLTAEGTFTTSGSELKVMAGGGDGSAATGYCVRGDTLTAEITIPGSGLKVIYTAKRK